MTQSNLRSELEQTLVREFLAAVIRHAQYRANLVTAALKAFDVQPPISLPPAFLLELAALMELRCWEEGGIRDHIEAGFPTFAQAAKELADRAEKGPREFADSRSATLSDRVFRFWLTKFSWGGLEVFGAGVLVHQADEDLLVEQIAEFLWENRHRVNALNQQGDST